MEADDLLQIAVEGGHNLLRLYLVPPVAASRSISLPCETDANMHDGKQDKPKQHRRILAWMKMPCSPFGTLLAAAIPILITLIGITIAVLLLSIRACR